jgi:hypothetical protein
VPIDATEPRSPGWWLQRLIKKLGENQDRYDSLDTYYRGENGIPAHAHKSVKQAYRRLMSMSRTNFAELVVEPVRERMVPVGFRTGAGDDGDGDAEAWRIWQANSLDADSALVHRASLSLSLAHVIVGPVDPDIGVPVITPEDPREVVVETDPVRRRKVIAALKVFADETAGAQYAYLYLPGAVIRAARPLPTSGALNWDLGGFEWDGPARPLPANVVPVVPFPNRSSLGGGAVGEFEPHLPILDRINYTLLSRLEIATLQAFRQRAVIGDLPDVDEHGLEIDYDDIFESGPDALWRLPQGAQMWESGAVDLGPIRAAIRDDIQDLAAVTRTPLFYLTPDAANGSAEGASLMREGLVFKTHDRIVQATESWEQVMSLAFLFAGDLERSSRPDMEVMWASPERRSLAERADAAVKAKDDLPWATRLADIWQMTPQQIERMRAERVEDAMLADIEAPLGLPDGAF